MVEQMLGMGAVPQALVGCSTLSPTTLGSSQDHSAADVM